MDISVIIPSYKPQDYLWECLDSLASQTFPKDRFEVILVLNGCEEPYKAQIEKYIDEHKDLHIRFIHTLQGGVSNARNIALDCAEGEYICFIDDDDYVSPTYLEELHSKASEDTIAISDTHYFVDGQTREEYSRMAEMFEMLSPDGKTGFINARRLFFSIWMKLIPRKMIGSRRFPADFSVGEDCLFMFLISDRFKYVDFTSDNAIYYRRMRPDSAMGTQRTRSQIFLIDFKLIMRYTKFYLSGLRRYSTLFYLSRIEGPVLSVLMLKRSSKNR